MWTKIKTSGATLINGLVNVLENKMKKKFSYAGVTPPKKYKCAECKVTGIKLWREYQTFSPQLLCGNCAIKDQSRPGSSSFAKLAAKGPVILDANGGHEDEYGYAGDQIGWYVPAVPDEEGIGYWGYSSVPQEGVTWWKNLPTYKV
jgi:hypothetical protein